MIRRFEFCSFPNIENICFVFRRMSESQTVNNTAGRNRMKCLRHSRVQHQLFYIYIHSIEISAHMSNECTFYNAYVDDTQLKSANALHSNLWYFSSVYKVDASQYIENVFGRFFCTDNSQSA